MTEETTRQVLPTATGFAARQAIVALRKHNIDDDPLLRRVGLSERDLDDRQGRISANAQSELLEYAAETLKDTAFGLHLAEQANPREVGLVFYVGSAAKNVGEALALYARYGRIVNEAMRAELRGAKSGVVVEFIFLGVSRHRARQNAEFRMAAAIKTLREIAGRNIHPAHVLFAHAGNSNGRELQRFFGCPVEFGASIDQMAFSSETLALPLVTEDRHLLDTLQPICDEAAKMRNTAKGTLRASVENEVQKLLHHGNAQRETVAKNLAMSARTLARRLADENTTYEEVVDQLRRSLALQYVKEPSPWIPERSATRLREADLNVLSKLGKQGLEWRLEPEAFTGREVVVKTISWISWSDIKSAGVLHFASELRSLSLSQIAWLLGYEGSSSFNHAFLRWTGRPPSAARDVKQLLAAG